MVRNWTRKGVLFSFTAHFMVFSSFIYFQWFIEISINHVNISCHGLRKFKRPGKLSPTTGRANFCNMGFFMIFWYTPTFIIFIKIYLSIWWIVTISLAKELKANDFDEKNIKEMMFFCKKGAKREVTIPSQYCSSRSYIVHSSKTK